MKTVIKIESPRPAETKNLADKRDSESVSSDTSSSLTSDADSSPVESKNKHTFVPYDSSRRQLIPQGDSMVKNLKNEQLNNDKIDSDYSGNGEVEYMNTGKNRILETGGNSSDTDSGVGGEGDRTMSNAQENIHGRSNSKEEETYDWDTPPDTPKDALESSRLELARQTELQLDLSKYMSRQIKCK